jgi:hypothetical protein
MRPRLHRRPLFDHGTVEVAVGLGLGLVALGHVSLCEPSLEPGALDLCHVPHEAKQRHGDGATARRASCAAFRPSHLSCRGGAGSPGTRSASRAHRRATGLRREGQSRDRGCSSFVTPPSLPRHLRRRARGVRKRVVLRTPLVRTRACAALHRGGATILCQAGHHRGPPAGHWHSGGTEPG